MIQRIQSLLLALVAVFHLVIFFIPVFTWEGYSTPGGIAMDTKVITALHNIPVIVINCLIIVFSVVTIFQYKNRKKQRSWVQLLTIFIILNLALYTYYMITITLGGEYTLIPLKSYGVFLQVVSIFLCLIAARRIKKDDDLVKSVDRIR